MLPISDGIRTRTTPVVTILLLAANFVVFFHELSLSPHALKIFLKTYGVVPYDFVMWQHGRLTLTDVLLPYLTSQFIHGGWAHILGNMLFLWIFGKNVEDSQGSSTFLAFYLVCGFAAGVAQTLIDPLSQLPQIGASGAIAGVLGAFILYYPGARIRSLVFIVIFITTIEVPAWIYLGIWFGIQFFNGVTSLEGSNEAGGVAFFAHIGGFVSGMILGPLLRRR